MLSKKKQKKQGIKKTTNIVSNSTHNNRKIFRRRIKIARPSSPLSSSPLSSSPLSSSLASSTARAKDSLTNLFLRSSPTDVFSPALIIVWYLEARDGVSLLTTNKEINEWLITSHTKGSHTKGSHTKGDKYEAKDEKNSSAIIQWWRDQELLRIIRCQRSLMMKLCNAFQLKQQYPGSKKNNDSWRVICKVEGDDRVGAKSDINKNDSHEADIDSAAVSTGISFADESTYDEVVNDFCNEFHEEYEGDFTGMACLEDLFYYFRQSLMHGYGILGLFDTFSFGHRTSDEEILGTLGGFGFPQDVLMQMKRFCTGGTTSVADHFNKVKQQREEQLLEEQERERKEGKHRRLGRRRKEGEKKDSNRGKGRESRSSRRTFLRRILPPLPAKRGNGRMIKRRCNCCDMYLCPSEVIFYSIERRKCTIIGGGKDDDGNNNKISWGLRGLRRVSSKIKKNKNENSKKKGLDEQAPSSGSSLATEETSSTYSNERTLMEIKTINELYCSKCLDKNIHLAYRFLSSINRSVKMQEKQYTPSYLMGLSNDNCCLLNIRNEMIPLRKDEFMVNVRCHPTWDGDGDTIDSWLVCTGPRDPTVRYIMHQIDEEDEMSLSPAGKLAKSLCKIESASTLPRSNIMNKIDWFKDDGTVKTTMTTTVTDFEETFFSGLSNAYQFTKSDTVKNNIGCNSFEREGSQEILRHIEKMDEDAKLLEKMMERYSSSSSSECSSLVGERTEIMQEDEDYKDQFHYDEYFDSNYYSKVQDDEKSRPSDACTKTTVTNTTSDAAYLLMEAAEKMNTDNCAANKRALSSGNSSSLGSDCLTENGGLNSYYYDSTFSSDDENNYQAVDGHQRSRSKKGKHLQDLQDEAERKLLEKGGTCELQFAAFDPSQDIIQSSHHSTAKWQEEIQQREQDEEDKKSSLSETVEAAFIETDHILSNALAAFHEDMVDFSKKVGSFNRVDSM
eukprot:CAMPEP_0194160042 /NCGR_PEP_ID=MMETSP0152-20130528/78171_1 /TAXON_ID=1049557 /ORGANISM="Thalassiothrix antarctica, Strain L6-D1" /LENGTH=955 /DNA_ID=CAMNT_0038869685 /DNA_START=457 /DNA_END=3324 /DNA_ORIENTATION=-